jgi:signal transduction histidine kinase
VVFSLVIGLALGDYWIALKRMEADARGHLTEEDLWLHAAAMAASHNAVPLVAPIGASSSPIWHFWACPAGIDGAKLRQARIKLLSNACKYSSGNTRIAVDTVERQQPGQWLLGIRLRDETSA